MQQYATLALAFAPLLASANPLSSLFHSNMRRTDAPTTAEVKWDNPTGGNVQLGYADSGMNFGSVKPSDIIRNNVSTICSTVGTCVGNNDVTLDTKPTIISGGELDYLEVTLNAQGDYPTWVHNGLIDMLAWAIDNQTTKSNECYNPHATSMCNPMAYCPQASSEKQCFDQYTAPGAVAVVLAGDMVDKDAAPGYISLQFDTKKPDGDGLCSKLTTFGSGMSAFIGEAGGPAGGIFTLMSLFCQD